MPRPTNMPNPENCSLVELETAAQAAISRRSHVRLMAIKALIMGVAQATVAGIFGVCVRTLSRWVTRFNQAGIDGLIEGARPGRPRKITPEQSAQYEELIEHPEYANYVHWTARKFHGYLRKELEQEIGYRTVVRWLHRADFRLKVPRPWPNGQDDEKRKVFVEQTRTCLEDTDIDLWYLDETGIEGDPRPRRRWAKKGKKIRQPYQGTHIRMSATGLVCPRTGEFYALMIPHSNTTVFQIFLDNANADVVFERKRNLLILDNASWHKSKSLNMGRFERVFLPPYSPDLNPIERLWMLMKGEWFSDFYARSREELTERLINALNWITDRRELNKRTCGIPTKL
jgi:transposase